MQRPYLTILEKEIIFYEEQIKLNPLRFQDDPYYMNVILQLVLRHHDWSVNQILDWFQAKHRIQVKLNIRSFLARFHILKPDGRAECEFYAEEVRRKFLCLLSEDNTQARDAYNTLREVKNRIRRSWPAVTRMVLLNLANDLENSGNSEEKKLGQRINRLTQRTLFLLTSKYFNAVLAEIVEARGFTEIETVTEQISGIIEDMAQYETVAGEEAEAPDITLLQEENSDLKAALFGLKHELTDLQTRIKNQQEAAQMQALVSFLSEMNTPSNGHLLDNIVHSSNIINSLLISNWQPETPELEGIVFSLKMLTDFLLRLGISPIKEIGSHEQITMKDLTTISYIGSEFQSPDQNKSVQYRSPGWAYKNQIISRPQAIEVIPAKGMKGDKNHAKRP